MFMLPGNWELPGPIPMLLPVLPIGIPTFAPGAWPPGSEGKKMYYVHIEYIYIYMQD
jgi:hypothetical protein